MSKLTDKLLSKLLALMIIVLFIIGFREAIITDKNVSTAFGAIMGVLPFAKVITNVICKIMKYQYSVPIISTSSVITDFLKLAVMSIIHPVIGRFVTRMFLPLPNTRNQILSTGKKYEMEEEYMNSFGYKLKSMIITIIISPLEALLGAYLVEMLFDVLIKGHFGENTSNIWGVISIILLTAVSVAILVIFHRLPIGVVVLWRILVSLLAPMATTLITNTICLFIYIALIGGVKEHVFSGIITLVVWLIFVDFIMQCLRRMIVWTNPK